MTQVVVIAKEPVAGRVKTRLTPPFSPFEAARLAQAALTDTLTAIEGWLGPRPVTGGVLALEGLPGMWLPKGFVVIPQRGGGLDERLAAAFTDAYRLRPEPVLLVGMDTPQLTPELLTAAAEGLADHDAVFGPATDGGFWLLGLRRPDPALLLGVPMSVPETGAVQVARLVGAGLSVRHLPTLTDVDTAEDAYQVAAQAPGSHFAKTLNELSAMVQR